MNLDTLLDLKTIAMRARNAEYNPKVRGGRSPRPPTTRGAHHPRGGGTDARPRWCAPLRAQRFASVVMRIRDPKTTALIFASGKVVCTGAKSEKAAKDATRKYAKIIQKLDFPAKFKDFKIQNVVASVDLKFPVRLEGLAFSYGAFCQYEPELFPGLVFRIAQPKVVLLIFVSGKVVFTGAKERAHIVEAFNNIYPVLLEFKKQNN